ERMPALRSWMAPRRISSPVTRIAARGDSADAPDLRRRDDPAAGLAAEVLLLARDRHVELGGVGGAQVDPLEHLERALLTGREDRLVHQPALRVLAADLHPAPV